MSNGYVRQSSGLIITGAVIQASHFNNEFNALQTAFSGTVGHDHTGGTGMGPIITPAAGGTPYFLGSSLSGTDNAIVIGATVPNTFTLIDKYIVAFRPANINTGPVTVNVVGTGAIPVKKVSLSGYLDLDVGDFEPGLHEILIYDANSNVFQSLTTVYEGIGITTASGFTVGLSDLFKSYLMSAAATVTLPAIATVPSYFYFNLQAKGGDVTITPNVSDSLQGGTAGTSYVMKQGTSGIVYVSNDGKWYINGTALTQPLGAGGTGAITALAARANLGLVIGSDIQAYSSQLAALAAYNTNGIFTQTASGTYTGRTITGTSGTIAITNGSGVSGNPTITIDSGYVGQSTITTLGTIATGVWSGTTIGITKGGTGQTTATAAFNALAPAQASNSGKYLTTDGTNTSWGTVTAGFSDPGANGLVVRTSLNTSTARTITGSTNIAVTNGDGVSGNPTLAITSQIPVANGGTGLGTLTVNNVILGNGTSTPTFVAPGTSGNVLTSDGTTWNSTAIAGFVKTVKKQIFTSTGTYTPSTGMLYCIVEAVAGGGAGGGCANNTSAGTGGAYGGYSRALFAAVTIGASKSVTIGAGGTGVSGGTGGTGGTTSITGLITCNGGVGGISTAAIALGGVGGTATGGDINIPGIAGGYTSFGAGVSGYGASGILGSGGISRLGASDPGAVGTGFGSGGSGGFGQTGATGGAGAPGIVIITEFCSQ